jgi:glutamyl-tRNA synthetase
LGKDVKDPEETKQYLEQTLVFLDEVSDNIFTAEQVKASIWDFASERGRGKVLWPMRYALSGKDRSPDPFTLAAVLGKEETLARLRTAITTLENIS